MVQIGAQPGVTLFTISGQQGRVREVGHRLHAEEVEQHRGVEEQEAVHDHAVRRRVRPAALLKEGAEGVVRVQVHYSIEDDGDEGDEVFYEANNVVNQDQPCSSRAINVEGSMRDNVGRSASIEDENKENTDNEIEVVVDSVNNTAAANANPTPSVTGPEEVVFLRLLEWFPI